MITRHFHISRSQKEDCIYRKKMLKTNRIIKPVVSKYNVTTSFVLSCIMPYNRDLWHLAKQQPVFTEVSYVSV